VIVRRDLANELGKRGLAEWVVIERAQQIASIDGYARVRRREQRTLWQLTLHVDTPDGRGSAHVTIDAVDGTASEAVDHAIMLARASIGPAWVSRPLAAPARVKLDDSSLAARDVADVVRELVASLPRGVDAKARVMREQVSVLARQGFRTEWTASLARVDALAVAGSSSLAVAREARQLGGLELAGAFDQAKRDLELLQKASAPAPGPCALVLRADAMLHDGVGVWAAFASQADAVVERQGLTRYRERTPIAPGADQVPEPLTIRSNGALDFGVRSAPLGDYGDAVRVFALVERGIAAGLALSPREGALRGRDPNGGVRNLEVATGSWTGTVEAITARVVEVRRLRSLTIDPYSGEASLEIALGFDHRSGKPFRGGSIRLDLIAGLAHARRSAASITRGAYKGPNAILVESAELLA
jgi:predicted Zn-dependent protease